ncbi:unnamed protein product [Oppiella nova]|uniref:GH18 domain-containing protein n=1 Tax=Oppiella nova TaxID=334625 RepID=A0A7R9MHX7_9ACAR|nr:unnamed protein product [Oppiella nova]CAG2177681.1 unnamed protein product [Oppiella nova]
MLALRIAACVLSVISAVNCGGLRAAPYYMPLDNNGQDFDFSQIIKQTGVKQFILAFPLATDDGKCIPTWDGKANLKIADDTVVLGKVKQIRASGGDVSVSFGGYNGVELGHVCGDVNALVNAYQTVIDKYSLTNVDFDIEGDDLGDVQGETLRAKAIKVLKDNAKAKGKDLFVTLTLPSTTVGLSELGKAEIKRTLDLGAHIDLYKIMAFDYGGPGADQVNSVITVMEDVHKQLKQLRPDLNEQQVYASTGLILMNGHTDQPSEKLIDYANQKKLGRVSYWALNRDRQCTGPVGWVNGTCSSVTQQPWDFTKTLANFH